MTRGLQEPRRPSRASEGRGLEGGARPGSRGRAAPRRRARAWPRPRRGSPGKREDTARAGDRAHARGVLQPHPVHPRHRAARARRRVRREVRTAGIRAGRRLHERPPRGRDQPHAAAHAVGSPRGDAGAPGHGRGPEPQAQGPVPRHRDAERERVRGRLPAAGVAARPVPLQGRARVRGRDRRARHARPPARRA